MTRNLRLNSLFLMFFLAVNGCRVKPPVYTVVPLLDTPTPVPPAILNATPRTSTPTFAPITPEPTETALYRVTEILSKDYGQHLTLFVGDTLLLLRLPGDHSPLIIDNIHVLQALGDEKASSVLLRAVGTGNTLVSSWITAPCPNSPVGCQPPMNFIYVDVTVIDH